MTHPEAPLGEFRFSTGKSHLRLSGWTLLILAPIALFLLAARGNIDNLTGNQIAIGIFLLVMIAAMLLNFLFTRIDVYSDALVQKRFFSKHTFYFSPYMRLYIARWRYGLLNLTIGKHTAITLDDDYHYHLPPAFRQNEKIISVIESYLFSHSMHMLNQTYDTDETLNFGAIQLNRHYIVANDTVIARDDIAKINVNQGKLKIYTKNKKGNARIRSSATVHLDKIANFRLLCRFIGLNEFAEPKYFYRIKRILWFI
ncbi:DUF6585 family protein [Conchiformibius steedae]|uniref:DUF6585 family protein n=1 Tax=Conchiformibius steedae TaxID=153493 RepID=UPI0026F0C8FF|nr:DUF6585 family protein [Conchiformibius steedae]